MSIKHERAIYLVCRCCCSKATIKTARTITPSIKQKYKETFNTDLDLDSPYYPKVLCLTCHRFLYSGVKDRHKMPPLYKFNIHHTRNFTENCNTGNCEICNVANSNLDYVKINRKIAVKNKRAPLFQPSNEENSPDYSLYKCCGARKGPGFHHDCNKVQAVANFQGILKKRKIDQPLAAQVIRETNDGDTKLKNLRGKSTRVVTNPAEEKENLLSLEDIKKMKRKGEGVSNELLDGVLGVIRQSKTTSIKVTSLEEISEDKKRLELQKLIVVDELQLDTSTKKYQHKIENIKVVSVQDIPALLRIWKPNLKEPFRLKICGDHGQEFYKQTLHVCSEDTKSNSTLDTMVICAVQVPEQTSNLAKLYGLDWYKSLESYKNQLVITNDYKVTNQLLGIMLGKYPCPYCHWEHLEGFLVGPQIARNRANLNENYTKLQTRYGGNGKDFGKLCNGVFAPAVIDFENPMDVIAPPELHLMEGVFHHIYLPLLSSLTEESKEIVKATLVRNKIYPSKYNGGKYQGNEVRKMLKNASQYFQPIVETIEQQNLLNTLIALDHVVATCFSTDLDPTYTNRISDFIHEYKKTSLSVTLKAHVIAYHVAEYIQKYGEPNKGLGYLSEQANEATHHVWKQYWKRYAVRMQSNLYGPRIKLCLEDFIYNRLPL